MTPAIETAKQANVRFQTHKYEHDPATNSYGEEAAVKLGIDPERVFKTLVVTCDDKSLAVAVLPLYLTITKKETSRTDTH